jgi:periplasmic protein TonB
MDISIRKKSMLLTLLIHGVMVLLLFYFVLTTPVPPMGGGEGVLVNIGYVDLASGEIQPMSENISEEPAVQETPPPVKAEEVEVATQDLEDAPVITPPKPAVKKPEIKPVIKETPVKVSEAPVKPVVKSPDPRALYKGRNTGSTSQGTGTSGTGDQGNPLGDPFSKEYGQPGSGSGSGIGFGTGTGSGSGTGPGISFDLSGRSMVRKPTITDDSQEQGRVVIDVTVDKNGKVLTANGPGRGSTTTSSVLVRKAKEAAMKTHFSPSPAGVEEQRGTMTFNFILR